MFDEPSNFIELIEYRLEKARLYKKVTETQFIVKKKKKTKALEDVNAEIRKFAEKMLLRLQDESESKPTPKEHVPVQQATESAGTTAKVEKEEHIETKQSESKPLVKKTNHRERKKVKTDEKEYPFQDGQMAKLTSTESLTAVNAQQAQKFIMGDEIKVMRCYTNQFDDDVAEILKMVDNTPVKAIISLEEIEQN